MFYLLVFREWIGSMKSTSSLSMGSALGTEIGTPLGFLLFLTSTPFFCYRVPLRTYSASTKWLKCFAVELTIRR